MPTDPPIEEVYENADEEWKAVAMRAVRYLAETYDVFPAEEVSFAVERWYPGVRTHEPRALGAVMRRAQAAGLIEPTDQYVGTQRSTRNSAPVRLWRSVSRNPN
jgi:hypothetical protein